MGWLRNVLKYLPVAWLGIKTLWSMYRAKVKQEGFRDALEKERDRRIALERDVDLRKRLDDPVDVRRKRILDEAEAARTAAGERHSGAD